MKKLLAFMTAITLMSCTAITAFAGERTIEDVPATITDIAPKTGIMPVTNIIYKIDIKWGSMVFDYSGNGVWDPNTHEYKDGTSVWKSSDPGTADKINVTNHSNSPVKSEFKFANSGKEYEEIAGTFTKDEINLRTAEGTPKEAGPTDKTYLSLAGTAHSQAKTNQQIGTVTVSVDKDTSK